MKGSIAALGRIGQQRAAALIRDGRLVDFLVEPAEPDLPMPGAIYRATVDRPLKGQGGAILRLPGHAAFLARARRLRPGGALLVQVTGFAETGKAVPVTDRILFKSRYAIVTPDAPGFNISRAIRDEDRRDTLLGIAHDVMQTDGPGLIIRSAAGGADDEEIAEDIAAMRDLAETVLDDQSGDGPELLLDGPGPHLLAWREWPRPDIVADGDSAFRDHGVEELLAPFFGPRAALANGASLFVEPTRALVAVDVNTGGDTSPAAGLKANIAAARELPRQLRIRGLGGQVTVDFAPMPKKERRQLEQVLKSAFREDPVDTAVVGWTPLGHLELQRKRERRPLSESLPR